MPSLISLPMNFCSVTMASRWSKDKTPATANPIVKKEPVSSLDIVNCLTLLSTIPKPNYSSVLASSYDSYALTTVNQLVKTVYPNASNVSQYVKKQFVQNLFSIELNRASITNPFSYFLPQFHWIPEHYQKNVQYYFDILCHKNSITIRAIKEKANSDKIIYHSVFLNHIISEEMWGPNLASIRMMPSSFVPYSYHDYLTAWFQFMLLQYEYMSHSWFVNFDKNFNFDLPLWLTHWWTQFGSTVEIFPDSLMNSFTYFKTVFKVDSYGAKFPPLLHFIKKYKVPWILKWQYEKEGDVLTCHQYVKWWDKFPHTQSIINNVTREFSSPSASPALRITTLVQKAELADAPVKSIAKSRKKGSPLNEIRKDLDALYALIKMISNEKETADSEDQRSSEASVTKNPYYPYNQEWFE